MIIVTVYYVSYDGKRSNVLIVLSVTLNRRFRKILEIVNLIQT